MARTSTALTKRPHGRTHGRACPGHLPWMKSSFLELPGLPVSCDCIGGYEEFSHDGGEGDLAGSLVMGDEPVGEVLEGGRMSQGSAGGVEEDLTDVRSAVAGGCTRVGFAALSGVWGESDEGGDLLGGEEAELRQLGDEGGGCDRADTLDGAQELGELGGLGIAVDGLGDVGLDGVEAITESRSCVQGSAARAFRWPERGGSARRGGY